MIGRRPIVDNPIPVAIDTPRRLVFAAIPAIRRPVYAINPMAGVPDPVVGTTANRHAPLRDPLSCSGERQAHRTGLAVGSQAFSEVSVGRESR